MEADTAEEAYAVAREAGFQGSTEDLQKAIQEELLKSSADELSDAELEAVVVGGLHGPEVAVEAQRRAGVVDADDERAAVGVQESGKGLRRHLLHLVVLGSRVEVHPRRGLELHPV